MTRSSERETYQRVSHTCSGLRGSEGFVAEARIGQRYKKVDAAWVIWEVVDIGADLEGIRHCRIVDVNDRTNKKLISEKTLTNRKLYQLVSEA